MRFYIAIEAEIEGVETGTTLQDLEQKVDHLLCFGSVMDAFREGGIDLRQIQVVNETKSRRGDTAR